METEPGFVQLILPQFESSPSDHHPKLKRLKKKLIKDYDDPSDLPERSEIVPKAIVSDMKLLGSEEDLEKENASDGLDPLFWEEDQSGAKRALDFDDLSQEFDEGDADFKTESDQKNKKRRPSSDKLDDKKEEKKKKRSSKSLGSDGKQKISKRKEKEEQKAHLAQLADFQRVMRERKGVGFKPVPMVEKPISSVLEKIRRRKMEVFKKTKASRSIKRDNSLMEVMVDDDTEENDYIFEVSDCKRPGETVSTKPIVEPSATDTNSSASPVKAESEGKSLSIDEGTSAQMPLVEETTQTFRTPVNDTQDLFSESQTSDIQDDQSNEESGCAAEDVAHSLPLLNLKFDSALPDDISSDEEENEKENIDPHQKHLFKGNSPPNGDPVKKFVDEEALEDDSDDDLLNFHDEVDEGDDADIEEIQDYIASDCKEKSVDRERCNELHQMWLQQQDEAGTENLLQKLKYGTKQRDLPLSDDDDDGRRECVDDESDNEDTGCLLPTSGARMSTKKLKQMIPQMFTDVDDGFVSSEDEETERKLYKERLLQKVGLEEQSKFLSPAEDETSSDVFGRVKKLNIVPEAKRKPKTSSCFDSLLMKGGSGNSSKSSFLRRASSSSMTSSHRGHGPSTVRSFIFGRDDSNSKSSISLSEESSDLSQKESQAKRSASAKFISSQAKWSNQQTEIRSETLSGTSLFDILKGSCVQAGHHAPDNMDNHQAVFAAFKSVKKSIKIEGRP